MRSLLQFCHERLLKARPARHFCSMRQFDFIIALCAAEHVLSDTVALSNMLQGKHVDLIEAVNESFVVINVLREQRNDELVWEETFERAKAMAAEWNIERTMPRLATNQRHRVNVPATTPKEYWRRALYLPLVDYLLEELNERLLKQHHRLLGQYLIPTIKDPAAQPRFSTHMNPT